MGNHDDRKHTMEASDFFAWQSQTIPAEPFMGDDDLADDVDEPPDHSALERESPSFQKSLIRPKGLRTESLLTRQFTQSTIPQEVQKPQIRIATDLSRRRSCISIASAASTADLTSDGGGLTSPARTSTPSPSYHGFYMNLIPHQNVAKGVNNVTIPFAKDVVNNASMLSGNTLETATIRNEEVVLPAPHKRCVSFACAAKPQETSPTKMSSGLPAEGTKPDTKRGLSFTCGVPNPPSVQVTSPTKVSLDSQIQVMRPEPLKRPTTIKFKTPSKPVEISNARVESIEIVTKSKPSSTNEVTPTNPVSITSPKKIRSHSRSPSWTKKMKQTPPTPRQRDIADLAAAKKTHKPTYVAVSEEDSMSSEANRFHVFASDEHQEDDWIANDKSESKVKLTINDTLKKEEAFRQLTKEVEAEIEAEEEDDEDDVEDDNEEDEEEDDDEDDEDESDQEQVVHLENESAAISELKGIFSEHEGNTSTDGNESDNELGFGADYESDDGEYDFWTVGRRHHISNAESRMSTHRSSSDSSIDSLRHMSPVARMKTTSFKKIKTRKIKIRPGTPDLPDSTDFVCGTLDEDRPLESAYVSCMEQKRQEKQKRHIIPQDIDPSFPTSDLEDDDEEDDDDIDDYKGSEPETWVGHGVFEESDDDQRKHRGHARKSPNLSPKRLHSPPPRPRRHRSPAPLRRLHSPPPPKYTRARSPLPLKHHSPPPKSKSIRPKRLSSPLPPRRLPSPPATMATTKAGTQPRGLFDGPSREDGAVSKQAIAAEYNTQPMRSPPASLVQPLNINQAATPFGGNRPGLTIAKSLPRTPSAFCRQYRESRLRAANEPTINNNNEDGHTRGAMDITCGLQHKKARMAEKARRSHCDRARKGKECEKKLVPGRGAERMRQRGLQNAGRWDPIMAHGHTQHAKAAQYVLSV